MKKKELSSTPTELRCREVYNGSEHRRDLEEAATMRVSVANSAPRHKTPVAFDNRLTSSHKSETCLRISELLSDSKT
jgi:hypothetical protein